MMWTGPLVFALLLPAAAMSQCTGGEGGESCPDLVEDDGAGLAQLRLKKLHQSHQAGAPSKAAAECGFLSDLSTPLRLTEAQACVEMIEGPADKAAQTMESLAKFYKNFYAFAYIASDPPAGNYSFSPKFPELGIFGGENGGAEASLSKVDLIGDWEKIGESIPLEGTYPVSKWVLPTNSAFIKLRDCHPTVWNDGHLSAHMKPQQALNDIFQVQLRDAENISQGVGLEVSSPAANATVDGTLEPVVKTGQGSIVKSINGKPPMEWIIDTFLTSPAIPYLCVKSVGGRMNQLAPYLKGTSQEGIYYALGEMGSLSDLSSDNFTLELEGPDGAPASATWAWYLTTSLKHRELWNCTSFQCVVDEAPQVLNATGAYRESVMGATRALNESWDNSALGLMSPAPAAPRKPQSLAGVEQAHEEAAASVPDDVFAWLKDPSCTFGYLAFRKRPDGTEYGLFKYTMFTSDGICGNQTYEEGFVEEMVATWREFTKEAESRSVTNLLVDFAGNGGGTTTYAWQFVQLMEPDLPYKDTCGSLNRPIPHAYDLWNKINMLPLQQFTSEELGAGFQEDRLNKLKANPEMAEAVINNIMAMLDVVPKLFGGVESSDSVSNATSIIEKAITAGVTPESLEILLTALSDADEAGKCEDPFAGDAFSLNPLSMYQYELAYRFPELEQRGKYKRNLTAKIYECPPTVAKNLTNPFSDIVFVSDGTCGSSCYLAAGTSWAISRAYTNRSIRFATYGGIGGSIDEAKKTLSPTGFPGGNVNRAGAYIVNGILTCTLIKIALANIIGDADLGQQISAVWNEMTSLVPEYAEGLPGFTQSEVYQQAFGPNSPPAEYIFTPTDLYLPQYFFGVSGMNASRWNLTQLEEMHQLAAQAFGK